MFFVLLSLKVPFLTGCSDLDQLSKIFETLGTPSEDSWPVSNDKMIRCVFDNHFTCICSMCVVGYNILTRLCGV